MKFEWECTNCDEKFIEEIDTKECSEDFEIIETLQDIAKEHIAECMNWQEFFKFGGIHRVHKR